jgi:autotransporter-associated beta strand protein
LGGGSLFDIGAGTLTLSGANAYSGGTTVEAGMLSIATADNLGTGAVALDAGTTLDLTGSTTLAQYMFISGDPTYDVAAGQTDVFTGQISDGTSPGTVDVTGGGTLVLDAANTYSGGTTIEGGSTLEIGPNGSAGSGLITFGSGNNTLRIDGASLPTAPNALLGGDEVLGFAPGDLFDLAGIGYANGATAEVVGSQLEIADNGQTFLINLADPSAYAGDTFAVVSDGTSGSYVEENNAPCYCRGTLIMTDQGERPVEELAIDDRVMTVYGGLQPIKWIGRRGYDGRFIRGNRDVLPIAVSAGALAAGVPARDLWVSPGHALYLDGVLVPAQLLVNGLTITQAEAVKRVEYFHLEFEGHEIVFAEGAPAESYVESDNRQGFHNAHEFAELYPDDARPSCRDCALRVKADMPMLGTIREKLFDRAELLGHQITEDPDLYLIADGEIVRPSAVEGDFYTFVLDRKPGQIWLASRSAIPAELELSSTDTRRLGTCIERIVLRDEYLRLDVSHAHPLLREGFHEDEGSRRWTDGMGLLPETLLYPFAGALTIEVRCLTARLRYPQVAPELVPELHGETLAMHASWLMQSGAKIVAA